MASGILEGCFVAAMSFGYMIYGFMKQLYTDIIEIGYKDVITFFSWFCVHSRAILD